MTHFCRRNADLVFSVIAVMLASSGILLAQDQLSIPLLPATDGVPVDGVPVDENNAIESLVVSQDAAASVRTFPTMPLEELTPADPQIENELPPFNANEMAAEDRDDLLRGPVHEAFAEQVNSDPTPNMIVTLQPPEPVEELPPELKPNGREVEWISGYWAWDEDQDDFIWISGVWREIPQGFRWLPGYWTEAEGGFQWISGTWVSTQTTEIQYLADAPPETLELGPVGVAPASDQLWIPGTWLWNDTRYVWRPGYWSAGYENWVWIPARYQWTPRGYYHCTGYWDYPVNRRGVLFAPSYFNRRFRSNRITRFTPRVIISTNLLTTHFWVRPRYRHYYFGNYYNVAYANRGLTPWYQYPQQRRAFDPLYAYYSRGQRSNAYRNQLSVQFNLFVNQPNRRPAITFRDQDRWQHDGRREIRPNDLLGNRFQNLVDNSNRDRSGVQFVRLENRQREQVQQESRQLRDLGNQRRDVERSLSQLQKQHDGNLKAQLHGHEANRPDLRERLNEVGDSRGSNNDGQKSGRDGNVRNDENPDAGRNPRNKVDDSTDARTLSGRRDGSPRDTNSRDGNTREEGAAGVKDGDVKGRGAVADSLRLDPKADASKSGEVRNRNENTVRDALRNRGDNSSRTDQKADADKEPSGSNGQNAAARRIERDGSQERLRLPTRTRSVDAQASGGVIDSNKASGTPNSTREPMNRNESRVRSTVEGSVNSAINNAPATRNGAEGRERSRATDAPASNPPIIKRESTPRSIPATRSAPATRSTPAFRNPSPERTTSSPRATPAERATLTPRVTPTERSAPPTRSAPAIRNPPAERASLTPKSTPTERSAPVTRSAPVRNPGGGGAARSAPNPGQPRADTGGRVRSNPGAASGAGRPSGGAGGSGAAAAGKRGRDK